MAAGRHVRLLRGDVGLRLRFALDLLQQTEHVPILPAFDHFAIDNADQR
jgi:hypothetical protein